MIEILRPRRRGTSEDRRRVAAGLKQHRNQCQPIEMFKVAIVHGVERLLLLHDAKHKSRILGPEGSLAVGRRTGTVARHQRTKVKHIDARLDPEEVRTLLSRLCIKLGFCLPPTEIERMAASPPRDIDEFTRAVLVAEGYGVATSDPLFNRVRELVAQAFIDHQSKSAD